MGSCIASCLVCFFSGHDADDDDSTYQRIGQHSVFQHHGCGFAGVYVVVVFYEGGVGHVGSLADVDGHFDDFAEARRVGVPGLENHFGEDGWKGWGVRRRLCYKEGWISRSQTR